MIIGSLAAAPFRHPCVPPSRNKPHCARGINYGPYLAQMFIKYAKSKWRACKYFAAVEWFIHLLFGFWIAAGFLSPTWENLKIHPYIG